MQQLEVCDVELDEATLLVVKGDSVVGCPLHQLAGAQLPEQFLSVVTIDPPQPGDGENGDRGVFGEHGQLQVPLSPFGVGQAPPG